MRGTASSTGGVAGGRDQTLPGYLLALSRPRFWLYLAGPSLVGIAWAATRPGDIVAVDSLLVLGYFLVPANLFLYGVNDRYDAPIDARNPRKGEAGPEVRYRADRRVGATVLAAGLLAVPLVVWLPPLAAGSVVGFFALAVAYSAPPLRFKARPLIDSVSNGLYVLPGVVGYVAVGGSPPPALAVAAGWLWTMAMHTYSAIPDVEPDRAAGVRTTATVLGPARGLGYCIACWVGAAGLGALHHPGFGLLLAVYPVLGTAIGLSDVAVSRAYAWFPAVNGLVGMILTLAAIWRVVGGA